MIPNAHREHNPARALPCAGSMETDPCGEMLQKAVRKRFGTRCRDCRADSALISVNQIQTGITAFCLLCISFGCLPLSAQVPPGTGASGPFNDQNFKIATETLSPQRGVSNRAPAWIVTKRAAWAPALSGTQWIAAEPDQSNGLGNGRNRGSVTYQTEFMATPELVLNARVLADEIG